MNQHRQDNMHANFKEKQTTLTLWPAFDQKGNYYLKFRDLIMK